MDRVKSRESRVESQKRSEERGARSEIAAFRTRSSILAPRPPRRGVLLLVVLSMLVLFMLIGTAFLMSSGQSRDAAKAMARVDRLETHATGRLDRAAMDLLRDTENPVSAAFSHSLLRDFYGTDGFQGLIYAPRPVDLPAQAGYLTRYSNAVPPANLLGTTQGQFIDIYVRALGFSANDPQTTVNEAAPPLPAPDLRHVIKLDRNVANQPQVYSLPLTKGYFNGCLLTVTSGPATGQSARILDYEFIPPELSPPTATATATRMFRIRVMAFGRTDGQSLSINTATSALTDLAGASFIVNGRPFNGTGVGYNPLAATGQARLTALQVFPTSGTEAIGAELTLLPNARYFDPVNSLIGALPVATDPFTTPAIPLTAFAKLNDPLAAVPFFNYPTYSGPGDADEGYDAADFQNMWLALQTVTPRAQGRVVHGDPPNQVLLDANDTAVLTNAADFRRLDLEDVPLPSFHRPDLVNFWYHRLLLLIAGGSPPTDDHVRAILQPYGKDGYREGDPYDTGDDPTAVPIATRDLVASIKRKIMMRPIREDHPKFDGGNTQSLPADLSSYSDLVNTTSITIAIPYWEAVGPWDVDNDNDGVPDSVWIDLGEPVQELEDGTRVKALYATLIIDLDSRLNVNAHGLVDHIAPPNLGYVQYQTNGPFSLGPNLAGQVTSDVLPQGTGIGPPEISLRPLFPIPWGDDTGTLDFNANRSENQTKASGWPIDDYATLMIGRETLDSTAVSGRAGYASTSLAAGRVTPGTNYQYVYNASMPTAEEAVPELAAQLKFFQNPWTILQRSAFGTPPDLFGRYAMGLDYSGQPYYEVLYDLHDANNSLPRPLLTDSPYEMNLSDSQRRRTLETQFPDAATAFDNTIDRSFAGGAKGLNDDAPFSVTDLERVLRAWDADSGTLPSRLWDVVNAFDPLKLMEYDPYRITGMANTAFGSSNQPERLAAAQQAAGINRHLATTDSFGPPVPSITPPAYMLTAPDAIAPASKTAYQIAVSRRPPNTMAEMLELRIRRAYAGAGWPPTPFDDYDPNGDHDLDGVLNGAPDPEYNLPTPAAAQANRLTRAALINTYIQQLLAPELLAGKRLDLNRPFGDGRDNAGNGVDDNGNGKIDEPNDGPDPFNMANGIVDDPLEAGEPFLDVDGDGTWQAGEPFINLDGSVDASDDPTYTPPRDLLWADLTTSGVMAESIAFDYTNGFGYPVFSDPVAKVRNLESQARQVYARHLYCLMLMLVDENYIAPWDDNDPQIRELLDAADPKSQVSIIKTALDALPPATPPVDTAQEARRIVLRKLTTRAIAQWAVNCADMRDADAIMTPFEYDENPWDGWGCMGATQLNVPLDGDAATDENLGEVIDWANVPKGRDLDAATKADNYSKVVAPSPASGTNPIVPPVIPPAALPTPLNQTRGLVWGVERPELLITETMGLHDRRTEDLSSDFTKQEMEPGNQQRDDDLDQRLRPKGSLYIELYNPWSPTGKYPGPAEIYSQLTRDPTNPVPVGLVESQGIELGRLSTLGVDGNGNLSNQIEPVTVDAPSVRRSPVWRVAVVEESPWYRNDDDWDNKQPNPLGTGVHKAKPSANRYKNTPPNFFESADPDRRSRFFYGQEKPATTLPDNEPYVERQIYFTSDSAKRFKRFDANDPSGANENFLSVNQIPDTPVKPQVNVDDKLRLPPQHGQSARYFIAADVRDPAAAPASPGTIRDVPIAPIKPGRYAVIGTAGAQYKDNNERTMEALDVNGDAYKLPRYVTTLSRQILGGMKHQTVDPTHVSRLETTRRIELFPCFDPEVQQVMVAANGGTPLFPLDNSVARRDNEVVRRLDGKFRNIYDGAVGDPANVTYKVDPDTALIPPCVAIPIKDLSISEPLDLYVARRKTLDADEKTRSLADPTGQMQVLSHYYNPEAHLGEGGFVAEAKQPPKNETPYDEPFDMAPELRRNGTTRNYRTIHLQRLADPTLPWNPLPTLPDGKPNPQHEPKLPVNIYRTIDSSSVDLTAFNGTSSREAVDTTRAAAEKLWLPENNNSLEFTKMFGKTGDQRIHMRSLERGTHALDAIAPNVNPLQIAARMLWRQEPINVFEDLQVWFQVDANNPTLSAQQQRTNELKKRALELRLRDKKMLDDDIAAIGALPVDPAYTAFPPALKPRTSHFDIVLDHTLGFSNESFGAMVSRDDVVNKGLPVTADGAPSPDTPVTDVANSKYGFTRLKDTPTPVESPVNSTYPWLAWGNRPFVSADELLNVPGTSSSQMLRQYSTIFRTGFNPYDGTGIDLATGNPLTVGQRLATYLSPFGHLLGALQTATTPAAVIKPPPPGAGPAPDWLFVGAPHYYRILEYVQTPSRFVGTDTMLTAEIFNDPVGNDITSPQDPRASFRPPYNRVSRERDPGKVNLNTVTGRRALVNSTTNQIDPNSGVLRNWSEVFDGIMHRDKDNNYPGQISHMGPAWRDVVLSRRGYAQNDAANNSIDKPASGIPDTFTFGLNKDFPSFFSNPFRSPNAGDLVPLAHMIHFGVDSSWQRRHHYNRGGKGTWGSNNNDDNMNGIVDETREAGFGGDDLVFDTTTGQLLPAQPTFPAATAQTGIPLFSESFTAASIDGERNPAFYYQPMTRMENLVTNRSNVFAIWITVGYFEVEPAPPWSDPNVQARFGGDGTANSPATIAAQALYNRVYPDGYMLGREVGSDTGNVKRPRGFYIVDRTEEVGFKPGEDLNVEKMIKLRRRIE